MVLASEILRTKETASAALIVERDFDEVRILGSGGQGTVSLSKERATGTFYALKTVLSKSRETELESEFNTVQHLLSSGVNDIVPIHHVDRDDLGQICVLMDFCNRGSLLSVLQQRQDSRLEEREAAAVLRSLAGTLIQCHSVGIMHRDIKPENVLVQCSAGSKSKKRGRSTVDDEVGTAQGEEADVDHHHHLDDGCCKFLLSDFGLACTFRQGHHIRDGKVAGTRNYIAPEIHKGAYDERADVWSLGVVLHGMLTGTFPPQSLYQDKEHVPKVHWSSPIYSHLSDGAKSMLAGMLKMKPRHRLSLSEICEHPWVKQQQQQQVKSISSPAKKRIRRVHGLPIAREKNIHHLDEPASASAAGVIRIKFGGAIIRELPLECKKGKKKQRRQVLPCPLLPVLHAC